MAGDDAIRRELVAAARALGAPEPISIGPEPRSLGFSRPRATSISRSTALIRRSASA